MDDQRIIDRIDSLFLENLKGLKLDRLTSYKDNNVDVVLGSVQFKEDTVYVLAEERGENFTIEFGFSFDRLKQKADLIIKFAKMKHRELEPVPL